MNVKFREIIVANFHFITIYPDYIKAEFGIIKLKWVLNKFAKENGLVDWEKMKEFYKNNYGNEMIMITWDNIIQEKDIESKLKDLCKPEKINENN